MEARVKPYYAPEGLMEAAYDFEDVIDDLIILQSSSKQSKVRNWKRCLLLIRIHKKLKLIKSKIPSLPHFPLQGTQFGSSIRHLFDM